MAIVIIRRYKMAAYFPRSCPESYISPPFCTTQRMDTEIPAVAHNGGYARGYHELFALFGRLTDPVKAPQAVLRAVFLCIGALGANVRICRRQGRASRA